MKYLKGHISIGTLLGTAISILIMLGSIFAWTFSQFQSVYAQAASTDSQVAAVVQYDQDNSRNIANIESEYGQIIEALNKNK